MKKDYREDIKGLRRLYWRYKAADKPGAMVESDRAIELYAAYFAELQRIAAKYHTNIRAIADSTNIEA